MMKLKKDDLERKNYNKPDRNKDRTLEKNMTEKF